MWKRSLRISKFGQLLQISAKFIWLGVPYDPCFIYPRSRSCHWLQPANGMAASRLLNQSYSHYPSSKSDIYVYSIVPCLANTGLALIDSADELLILDRQSLRNQGGSLPGVPNGVTCLARVDEEGNVVAASGRDGSVVIWDLRSGERVARYLAGMYLASKHGRSLWVMRMGN